MSNTEEVGRISRQWIAIEIVAIFFLLFVYAGWPTPDVNEAHYLAKAKHVWDPGWCPRDHFLNSAYAHIVFYWLFGWLTVVLPLPAVAWVGRVLTWLLLSVAWWRLIFRIGGQVGLPLLTAGLALCLWSRCAMAGEWVVGGFEAKSIAYAFVFLGLAELVANRWQRVWLLLGVAAAFHVLVGGWSVIACAICWMIQPNSERSSIRAMSPSLVTGFVISCFGILPSVLLTSSVEPELLAEANRVYVFERLAHHLVFHRFPGYLVARQVGCVAIWLILWWLSRADRTAFRLNGFVLGAVLIAIVGAILDAALRHFPDHAPGLLRYYWFRLADVAVPVGIGGSLSTLLRRWSLQSPRLSRVIASGVILVTLSSLSDQTLRRRLDPRPAAEIQSRRMERASHSVRMNRYQAWLDVCGWIQRNTPLDAIFLTPMNQQTFKWFAERGEVVTWKDVPQSAASLVEWNERRIAVQALGKPIVAIPTNESVIRELSEEYGFQFVLVERRGKQPRWRMPMVYSNSEYAIFDLGQMVNDSDVRAQNET